MKNRILLSSWLILGIACTSAKTETDDWLKKGIDTAAAQLKSMTEKTRANADTILLPRSVRTTFDTAFITHQLGRAFQESEPEIPGSKTGEIRFCSTIYDWTSGFFPGSLWYMYELTGNDFFKEQAIMHTNLLNPVKTHTGTHDLGFMMFCSFGNAERLARNDTIAPILQQTADNLITRFDPNIGCIRSWDFGPWNFPVIIDNMMNLELLFHVSRQSGNPEYKRIAVTHANTTLKHHFRPDASSFHVVSYRNDGSVECRQTFQGKANESCWARGQAWALYGYTTCFRETGDTTYLDMAKNIATLIMTRVTTDDAVPFWDYDAPDLPETPRDASAAAITASAMLSLYRLTSDSKYFDYAEKILKNLSSPVYLASAGSNQGFVLKHSTGSLPHGSEIDSPLNYADYYYLESLKKYMDIRNLDYKNL